MTGSAAVTLVGAALWRVPGLALPWLVDSLHAVASARMAGAPLYAPPAARQVGQRVLGANMGLYVNATVAAELASRAQLIVGIAIDAWVLGALTTVAALSVSGVRLSPLPARLSDAGQLMIGISLGSRFGSGFVRRAPAFLEGIVGISAGFLVAAAAAPDKSIAF